MVQRGNHVAVMTTLDPTARPAYAHQIAAMLAKMAREEREMFGPMLRRVRIQEHEPAFERGVAAGDILGHAGFPQSMAIVADALGLRIDRIDRDVEPMISATDIALAHRPVSAGQTGGVRQTYTAVVDGQPWYTATFTGHIDLGAAGLQPRDEIDIDADSAVRCRLEPGIGAQAGSAAMVANSIDRVIAAAPGWLTVADLPPARPAPSGRRGARTDTVSGKETA